MEIYIIRHGESVTNRDHLFGGWGEYPLSDMGRKEAACTGKFLKGIPLDHIYCSDLKRARETMEIAMGGVPEGVEYDPRLREINVGTISGKPVAEILKQYPDEVKKREKLLDYTRFGGEDYYMHIHRVQEFIYMLEKQKYEKAAVFCHEGTVRCFLQIVTGMNQQNPVVRKKNACNNASVSIFEYCDDLWRLKTWNLRP